MNHIVTSALIQIGIWAAVWITYLLCRVRQLKKEVGTLMNARGEAVKLLNRTMELLNKLQKSLSAEVHKDVPEEKPATTTDKPTQKYAPDELPAFLINALDKIERDDLTPEQLEAISLAVPTPGVVQVARIHVHIWHEGERLVREFAKGVEPLRALKRRTGLWKAMEHYANYLQCMEGWRSDWQIPPLEKSTNPDLQSADRER